MRKQYVKPQIIFEDFSLSENIAAGCEIRINNSAQGTCGYAYEGGYGATIFINETTGCSVQIPDSENNGFCYHVPIENNSLFNS